MGAYTKWRGGHVVIFMKCVSLNDVDNLNDVDKEIKREAAVLTVRMALISVMGLVASRLVLRALGVDDYGTYCAVAGLVWAFAFFNSSVTDSGIRFITCALGSGRQLRKVFSNSFWLHLVTAIVVALVAEAGGLWYLDNKIVLPPESRHDAFIVFQLVLASLIAGLIRQPYTALLLAHEKFRLYSCIEMAEAVMNLGLVALLATHGNDKLVLYAGLMFALSVSITLTYAAYVTIRYSESRLKWCPDLGIMKKMLMFSGCGVYGNMCVTAYSQGTTLVLNTFFGVAANASASLAATVSGVVASVATTGIMKVYSPRIMKGYAASDIAGAGRDLCHAARITVYSFGLLLVPAMVMMPELLSLVFGDVPPHTTTIARLSLFTAMTGSLIGICNTAIHATGDIRRLSFVNGTMYLLCPALGWMAFKGGAGITALFVIESAVMMAILANGCSIMRRQLPGLDIRRYVVSVAGSLAAVAVSTAIVWLILDFGVSIHMNEEDMAASTKLFKMGIAVIISFLILTFFAIVMRPGFGYIVKMLPLQAKKN